MCVDKTLGGFRLRFANARTIDRVSAKIRYEVVREGCEAENHARLTRQTCPI